MWFNVLSKQKNLERYLTYVWNRKWQDLALVRERRQFQFDLHQFQRLTCFLFEGARSMQEFRLKWIYKVTELGTINNTFTGTKYKPASYCCHSGKWMSWRAFHNYSMVSIKRPFLLNFLIWIFIKKFLRVSLSQKDFLLS